MEWYGFETKFNVVRSAEHSLLETDISWHNMFLNLRINGINSEKKYVGRGLFFSISYY